MANEILDHDHRLHDIRLLFLDWKRLWYQSRRRCWTPGCRSADSQPGKFAPNPPCTIRGSGFFALGGAAVDLGSVYPACSVLRATYGTAPHHGPHDLPLGLLDVPD